MSPGGQPGQNPEHSDWRQGQVALRDRAGLRARALAKDPAGQTDRALRHRDAERGRAVGMDQPQKDRGLQKGLQGGRAAVTARRKGRH
jgi:hypothetical protein